MNMYKRELKAHWKGWLIWCVAMFLMVILCMAKFQAGSGTAGTAGANSLTDIINKMPAYMKNLFGVGVFDMRKALDYYGAVFIYVALCAAVHAVMLGASMLGREERDKTIEFLAVKPVTRAQIITSKLLAGVTMIVVLNIVTLVASMMMVGQYQTGSDVTAGILALMGGMFGIQLIFLGIGTVCAACMKKSTRAGTLSMVVMLVTFFLTMLIQMAGNIDFLKILTPFEYFDAKEVLYGGARGVPAFSALWPILTAAVIAACLACSYIFYKKRDLKV